MYGGVLGTFEIVQGCVVVEYAARLRQYRVMYDGVLDGVRDGIGLCGGGVFGGVKMVHVYVGAREI